MESLVQTFHLDWGLFIAQVVNFFVVVVVLWYFAFKPLNDKMNDRAKTIAKSLEEAEIISKNLTESENEKKEILNQAKAESQKILAQTKIEAEELRKKTALQIQLETEKTLAEVKERADRERKEVLESAKKEMAEILTLALEKVMGKKMSVDEDKRIIAEALEGIKK